MKYLCYILLCIVGFFISYLLYFNESIWAISTAFICGALGVCVLNWGDKK